MAFRAFVFLRGKHIVAAAALVAGLGAFATPASAGCVSSNYVATCSDSTKIEAYSGSSFSNTYHNNGFSNGIGDVLQSTDTFNTDKLIATITQSRHYTTLELKFYTTFDGSGQGAQYADVFLGAGNTTSFTSAITLGHQGSASGETGNGGMSNVGFYGDKAGGANALTANQIYTSKEIWTNKSGTYGGKYSSVDNDTNANSGNWQESPTVVGSNAHQFVSSVAPSPKLLVTAPQTSVTETHQTGSNIQDSGYPYLVDVKLTLTNTDFNALFGGGLSVFWGTADCSNDAILAYIPISIKHVPEPLTLSLFSAGVVGAAAIRRRRKAKAA